MKPQTKLVLLLDEDCRFIECSKRIFKRTDLTLITANTPDAALSLVRQMKFHAIVSDENMPFIKGTQLLSMCKILQPTALRILIASQLTLDVALDAMNSSEVHKFFAKPFSATELIQYIQGTSRRSM